jgi:hypothetical protein
MKKSFFDERTEAEIKKLQLMPVSSLNHLIDEAEYILFRGKPSEHGLRLTEPITLPLETARKAMHSAGVTAIKQFRRAEEADNFAYSFIKLYLDKIPEIPGNNLGVVIQPTPLNKYGQLSLTDLRPLIIPWKEVMEGLRLYSYSKDMPAPISINSVRECRDNIGGVQVVAKVPSRTEKADRHRVVINHFPIAGTKGVYLSTMFAPSDDSMKAVYHKSTIERYASVVGIQDARCLMWDMVAASYEMATRDPGIFAKLPFPTFTGLAKDVYRVLINNTVDHRGKKLNDVQLCMALDTLIKKEGDAAIFHKRARDGKIEKYDWRIPGTETN